jgi:hypothetical protein
VDIVSVFGSRPALRWLVPAAAAAVVIGGGAAAGTLVASADPALPERSAAQLLVDLQTARPAGFSGTVVETADLGLPPLTGLTNGQGEADLTKLISGSNTARVWYAGPERVRLALLGTLGETDVVRNGTDLWIWRSAGNTATHAKLPADAAQHPTGAMPPGVPSTPQEAANAALAAIDPTTSVTTTGSAKVAGRDAYELVLAPKDTGSLVGQVRLAIDAKAHIPLRVDVYAKGDNDPAFRVAFQQISFAVPDAEQFRFNLPLGAVTTEQPSTADRPRITAKEKAEIAKQRAQRKPAATPGAEPTIVGTGWTSIVIAKAPAGGGKGTDAQQLSAVLNGLPKVSGSWGTGHLLQSKLFSALVTDDGRILAGAVAPDRLYAAAAK